MGFLSSIGNAFNELSGITSSSNAAFSQSAQLSRMSYEQQKEFAQNAHQWEIDDLRKAGINPAMTAQNSSAGAIAGGGSTGGSGSVGTSAMSPLGIVDAINSSIQTNSAKKLQESQGHLADAEAMRIVEMLPLDKKEKQALINKLFTEKERIRLGKGSEYTGTEAGAGIFDFLKKLTK